MQMKIKQYIYTYISSNMVTSYSGKRSFPNRKNKNSTKHNAFRKTDKFITDCNRKLFVRRFANWNWLLILLMKEKNRKVPLILVQFLLFT